MANTTDSTYSFTVWFACDISNPIYVIPNDSQDFAVVNLNELKQQAIPSSLYTIIIKIIDSTTIIYEKAYGIYNYLILSSNNYYTQNFPYYNSVQYSSMPNTLYYLSNFYFWIAVKNNCRYYCLNVYYNYFFTQFDSEYTCPVSQNTLGVTTDDNIFFLFTFVSPYVECKLPSEELWNLDRVIFQYSAFNESILFYINDMIIPKFYSQFKNMTINSLVPQYLLPAFYKTYDYIPFVNFNQTFPT